MCHSACNRGGSEILFERINATCAQDIVRANSDPVVLIPETKAYVVRKDSGRR